MRRRDVLRSLRSLARAADPMRTVSLGRAAAEAVLEHRSDPVAARDPDGTTRWARFAAEVGSLVVYSDGGPGAVCLSKYRRSDRWTLRWVAAEPTAAARRDDEEVMELLVLELSARRLRPAADEVAAVGDDEATFPLRLVERTRFVTARYWGGVRVARPRFAILRTPGGEPVAEAERAVDLAVPYTERGLALGSLVLTAGVVGGARCLRPTLRSFRHDCWVRALLAPTADGTAWSAWTRAPVVGAPAFGATPLEAHAALQRSADSVLVAPDPAGVLQTTVTTEAGVGDVPAGASPAMGAWREALVGLRLAPQAVANGGAAVRQEAVSCR